MYQSGPEACLWHTHRQFCNRDMHDPDRPNSSMNVALTLAPMPLIIPDFPLLFQGFTLLLFAGNGFASFAAYYTRAFADWSCMGPNLMTLTAYHSGDIFTYQAICNPTHAVDTEDENGVYMPGPGSTIPRQLTVYRP